MYSRIHESIIQEWYSEWYIFQKQYSVSVSVQQNAKSLKQQKIYI